MTMTAEKAVEFADRLREAVRSGEAERMRPLFTEDAEVWENTHGQWVPLRQILSFHTELAHDVPALEFEDVRVTTTESGYIDQHTKVFPLPGGAEYRVAACLVVQLRDGRVWRVEEYMDSAQKPPGVDPSKA